MVLDIQGLLRPEIHGEDYVKNRERGKGNMRLIRPGNKIFISSEKEKKNRTESWKPELLGRPCGNGGRKCTLRGLMVNYKSPYEKDR